MSRVCIVWCVAVISTFRCLEAAAVHIQSRRVVLSGESLWLNCTANHVHQVWWYKDNARFYTFERGAQPATQSFSVPGIYVDRAKSWEGRVHLLYTDRETEGTFLCDVATAPCHLPQRARLRLQVVAMDPDGPTIDGLRAQYNLGERIHASCTSGRVRPLPTLSWLINGKPLKPGEASQMNTLTLHASAWETSTLELELAADKNVFINGTMQVACVMEFPGLPEVEKKVSEKLVILGAAAGPAERPESGAAHLSVPAVVVHGQGFWLNCTAEGAHTIEWYKDNQQFYRDTPSDLPLPLHHSPEGVYVNRTLSRAGHVYLDRSDLSTEGSYTCKVILGEFRTRELEKEVQVYILPEKPPMIENVDPVYKMGDVVKASCSSGPSKPESVVTWHVGGVKVNNENVSLEQIPTASGHTFHTVARISLQLEPSRMENGSLLLACSAQVGGLYLETTEQRISALQPQEWALYYGSDSSGADTHPHIVMATLLAVLLGRLQQGSFSDL